MMPLWLHALSIIALVAGLVSFLILSLDLMRHPQHMAIMNVVWPVTCLFGTGLTVWLYYRYGRQAGRPDTHCNHGSDLPFPVIVAKGALHCGAGCMLGDLIAEWLAFLIPSIAIAFGWHWLFGEKIFAVWVLDFIFAFLLGIIFQYCAIAPTRKLSFWQGVAAALKADTLSLISWQIGMYGFMAFSQFYILGVLLETRAEVDTPEFWFLMQVAMLAGFATAYPVNWWLIRIGVKEAM